MTRSATVREDILAPRPLRERLRGEAGRPGEGMAMNHRVLIGFADALAAIESAWCLADDGFDVHVFARRGSRPALARSNAVSVIEHHAPEEDAERSAADLAAAMRADEPCRGTSSRRSRSLAL